MRTLESVEGMGGNAGKGKRPGRTMKTTTEMIMEGGGDSAATGKRLRLDGMKSTTAVGSNPWGR